MNHAYAVLYRMSLNLICLGTKSHFRIWRVKTREEKETRRDIFWGLRTADCDKELRTEIKEGICQAKEDISQTQYIPILSHVWSDLMLNRLVCSSIQSFPTYRGYIVRSIMIWLSHPPSLSVYTHQPKPIPISRSIPIQISSHQNRTEQNRKIAHPDLSLLSPSNCAFQCLPAMPCLSHRSTPTPSSQIPLVFLCIPSLSFPDRAKSKSNQRRSKACVRVHLIRYSSSHSFLWHDMTIVDIGKQNKSIW